MRRWGDGQGTHLTGAEHGEIHRRIEAGETFVKVAAAIGCSSRGLPTPRDSSFSVFTARV